MVSIVNTTKYTIQKLNWFTTSIYLLSPSLIDSCYKPDILLAHSGPIFEKCTIN